jgi:hypothetical protein
MCCFSGRIRFVRATKIFARSLPENQQALVYSMMLDTPDDVAMILPIPVAEGSGEKAVKFVALEKYPDFFEDLGKCFPEPKTDRAFGYNTRGVAAAAPKLEVVQVGSFNASYVPTVKDFSRLDAQFRLPDGVWDKLGNYARYGFAVFKLRKGSATVHPMAFTFPTALPGKLFFPTVHIHDGEVHPRAQFDHILYAQPSPRGLIEPYRWTESDVPASAKLAMGKSAGLVDGKAHVHRRLMLGKLKNEDVIIAAA